MSRAKLISVVGARPNFMKMAPILAELAKVPDRFDSLLLHTGQHYDQAMSDVFFRDLGMRSADYNLGVGSASHAVQTAEIMKKFEEVCLRETPDLVLVGGDVNSTLACSLTATKLNIPVAHVEAGLRSFDRTMPEEINRLVTDAVSDLLFTTEATAVGNLQREGIATEKIHFVGNTMIDSLVACRAELARDDLMRIPALAGCPFYLATIHRPSNVDDREKLSTVVDILTCAAQISPVLFSAHPRTKERLKRIDTAGSFIIVEGELTELRQGIVYLLPPLSYFDFLYAMSKAEAVLTDSGGIQEETTFLGIPCLTLRENTERPVTVEIGSNEVVGLDKTRILSCLKTIRNGNWKPSQIPPLWDGKAAGRIVRVLDDYVA